MRHRRGRDNYHLRELPSQCYHEESLPPDYKVFAFESIFPVIKLTGYKLEKKQLAAAHIAHNLIVAGISGKCVSDSRGRSEKGVPARAKVWDLFVAAGLADVCLGSEEAGKVTRYCATRRLLDMRREWELRMLVDTRLAHGTAVEDPTDFALLVLRSGKYDPTTGCMVPAEERRDPVSIVEHVSLTAEPGDDGKPDPQAIKNGVEFYAQWEDELEAINENNLMHSWKAYRVDALGKRRVVPVDPSLRKICIGSLHRAGRFYTRGLLGLQCVPKEVRHTTRIDNEPTAELDFGGMAPRMVYHDAGLDPAGDIYLPEQILPGFYGMQNASQAKRQLVRGFIKRATNILLNTTTRGQAHAAVARLIIDEPKRDFLDRVFAVDGVDVKGLVQRIVDAHPKIARRFFTGCGVEYMTLDGQIMRRILLDFLAAEKPGCGLHDAVLCKASDAEFARSRMVARYRDFFPFDPIVNCRQ